MTPSRSLRPGKVFTFYSYKGGVGRSMALSNVAALLANWGESVLIVDWDLEASGIEKFFLKQTPGLVDLRKSTPGVVDLVHAKGEGTELNWKDCVLEAYPFGAEKPLSIITAGRDDKHYTLKLQGLDLDGLFRDHGLGLYIEKLRNEWTANFDTVLIDSRTGITDIGGICTIHLPDVLVLLFTTTDSSMNGVIDVMNRARAQRDHFPVDRTRLVAIPVPARDESRTEYALAREWKAKFAERFAQLYKDWLPREHSAADVLDVLSIPYFPYWSFGEALPVVEEGTTSPQGLGAAYGVLARLITTDLDWRAVLDGAVLSEPTRRVDRVPDAEWLAKQRGIALNGFSDSGARGFIEILFYTPNTSLDIAQDRLLDAARGARPGISGSLIGLVVNDLDSGPISANNGIFSEVRSGSFRSYDYWFLSKQGDFYALTALLEDATRPDNILVGSRISETAEALLYSALLYRNLAASGKTRIKLGIRYLGLKRRLLILPGSEVPEIAKRSSENEVLSEITFLLENVHRDLVDLVQKLCEPLFLLFGFKRFERSVYAHVLAGLMERNSA